MVGRLRMWSYYVAFVAFVTIALWVAPPKPDPFPFDYTAMSAGYGSLLAGLGGFAITVLAVMLGLEALDAQRSTRVHVAAHGVVLRHVSLSLAIASVTCFVGALMLAEVNAQAASVVRAKEDASAEIGQHLEAMGLGQADIADRMLQLKGSGVAPFGPTSQVAALANELSRNPLLAGSPRLARFEQRAAALDQTLSSSARRHLLLTSVVALLSSLLILKSITFLLVVRFPNFSVFGGIQDFVVLGFGGMLLIKLLHMASYGLEPSQIPASRICVAVLLLAVLVGYRSLLGHRMNDLRRSVAEGELGRFTPAAPYLLALGVCFVVTVYLAATFANLGPTTGMDRWIVGLGAIVGTAMVIAIQVERPTLRLFVEADRQKEAESQSA